MSHNTLRNYYDVLLSIVTQRQKITWTEVEAMIPFERDIVIMGINHMNSQSQRDQYSSAEADYERMLKEMGV